VIFEPPDSLTRRRALAAGAGLLATAALPAAPAPAAPPVAPPSRAWGRIANRLHRGRHTAAALFFAGPPNPNSLPLYTRHPVDPDRLDWSGEADIRYALGQVAAAGLNTLKLSYFGHEGETDQWAPAWLFSRERWPGDGTGTYTEAEQVARARQLFHLAAARGLLVAPML